MPQNQQEEKIEIRTEDTDSLSIVNQRWNSSDRFYGPYITKTDKWYKLYRNEITKPDNEYRSKATVPVGFWTIETTVPRMTGNSHIFTLTPRDSRDPNATQYAELAKQYLDYVLDCIYFKRNVRVLAKDMKIFGSGFWKYGWDSDIEKPFVNNVPLRQLRIDPSVSTPGDIQKAKYVIYQTELTKREIEANPNYNTKGIDWEQVPSDKSTKENQSKKDRLASRGLNYEEARDDVEQKYIVREHWGWVGGKRKLIVILAQMHTLRSDKAPYDFWPFGIAINTEDPDNLLGIGDIEPIADQIEDLNTNRRMRTDNKNIRTNVMLERQRGANIREEDLVWKPGGIIDSNIPNGLNVIQIPDTTGRSVEEELISLQQIEKATNTPAIVQGQLAATAPSTGGLLNRTATAFSGTQQETNIRFKAQLESIDNCVEETLTNLWTIISQNISTEQLAMVVGEDKSRFMQTIPPEAIKRDYIIDIEYGSSAIEDQNEKVNQATLAFQTLSQTFGPEAAVAFLRDYLVAIGTKNVNQVIADIDKRVQEAAKQGNLPKPPQINVSLGGEDMNSRISTEILSQYFPISDFAKTPELFNDTRTLMFGQIPEELKEREIKLKEDQVKIELFKAITEAQNKEGKLTTEQLKLLAEIERDKNEAQSGRDGRNQAAPTDEGVETAGEGS